MSWFNVDDKSHSDDRFRRAGLDGFGLYAAAGSFCMDQLTDGFVPDWFVNGWPGGKKAARNLVLVALWAHVDGGFQYVEWKETLTRSYVQKQREKWREKWKRQAETRANSPPDSPGEYPGDSPGSNSNSNTNTNVSTPVHFSSLLASEASTLRKSGTALDAPDGAGPPCNDCDGPAEPDSRLCEPCSQRRRAKVTFAKQPRRRA
jgi:hypothetical protein